MTEVLLPVASLWRREVVRFFRQRSRWVGALAQPLVFWILLGGGLSGSFHAGGGVGADASVEYLYPGIVVMVLLFTAIFATISTVEDRREGFLQGVLVAPVPRSSIVLGQVLGATTLALLQGSLFLLLAPLAGVSLGFASIAASIAVMGMIALALTSLGLTIAWKIDSTQGFHAIMNLILLPIWFLSGALFPATSVPGWLGGLMTVNPLAYGLAALRRVLYWSDPGAVEAITPLGTALAVTAAFAAASFASAVFSARRSVSVS